MMQNIKPYLLFVILFLFQNKIQSQVPFSKKVTFPAIIESNFNKCKVINANNGGYWVIGSSAESEGKKTGGQIAHFTADGTILESKQVPPTNTGEVYILDFAEMPNGNLA